MNGYEIRIEPPRTHSVLSKDTYTQWAADNFKVYVLSSENFRQILINRKTKKPNSKIHVQNCVDEFKKKEKQERKNGKIEIENSNNSNNSNK